MSYRTWNRLLPDPFFRLRLTAIHRGKHGSDSESYSHKGTFVQSNFDDLFTSWSTGPNHDTLTLGQVIAIPIGNSDPWDVFGFIAGLGEWLAVYVMFSPEDGKLKKEDVRGIFDGSAFYKVAKAVVAKKHRAY
ncbi:hypothetical protein FRB99_000516 [Tulasnella sp. 403]|nr:hypothetical protein FRB99_000516 [Tulasnella sp. 403]